jgi:hypothetical protein
MLRRALSILLVYAILFQGGTKLGIYAYFQLNKEYISNVLCINKDKPALQCNGKCYFSKKLKSQEEKESNAPSQIKAVETVLFCDHHSLAIPINSQYQIVDLNSEYFLNNYLVYQSSVFHPPLS